ncbi:hypothetical protein [Methanobacterium alcaliphilum]|uniref:hypothetical protein n=1 Tax=Methanobacterium alcaliphilum TaxID=392018 RepID=UPI00200A0461|nr:hypothetical protein [Methanobacterium alcaliphilum]MCK9151487.1 hypothetical protein [Methanobacterium alcaliphilum]
MKKKIILLILAMFILSCSAAYAKDVTAIQKGPATAKKGENITLTYTIHNNGNSDIYNVSVADQNFYKFLGTIKAGQSKSFTNRAYIPTDREVKEDFGPDATVSNPFYIGGVAVSYQNANGKTFGINSNSLSIPLVSTSTNKTSDETIQVNITEINNTSANPSSQSIIQQIMDLINSIIMYVQNMFVPNSS